MADIEKNGFDAGLGLHISNAGAHEACADDSDFLDVVSRDAFGAVSAFAERLHVHEQSPDHALRLRRVGGLDEVAALDAQSGIDRHLHAFVDAGKNVALGRIVEVRLLGDHGVAADSSHRASWRERAVLHFVAFDVPRRDGLRVRLHPSLRGFNGFAWLDDFIDEAQAFGFLRRLVGALQDHHRGVLHADQARQTLRAASAGQ